MLALNRHITYGLGFLKSEHPADKSAMLISFKRHKHASIRSFYLQSHKIGSNTNLLYHLDTEVNYDTYTSEYSVALTG